MREHAAYLILVAIVHAMHDVTHASVVPAGLPGFTILFGGKLVVLSAETEIAAHYLDHVPAPGQFRLDRPYQQPAPGPTPDQAVHRPGEKAATGQVLSTPEPANGAFKRPAAEKIASNNAYDTLNDGNSPAGAPAAEAEPNEATAAPATRRKRKRTKAREANAAEQQVRCRCRLEIQRINLSVCRSAEY